MRYGVKEGLLSLAAETCREKRPINQINIVNKVGFLNNILYIMMRLK